MIRLLQWLMGFIPAPYRMVVGIAVVLIVVGGIWTSGFRTATRWHQVASLRTEIAQLKKAKADTDAILKAANERAEEAEIAKSELRKSIDAYQAAVATRPVNACVLTDADRRRLRGIAIRASAGAARRSP